MLPREGRLPAPAVTDWDFPRAATGIGVLVGFARARGIPAARVLTGTGLVEADLVPAREVTARQELTVVRHLLRIGNEPGAVLGARVGERYRPATFGVFGLALLAAPTVGEAIATTLRYLDLSFAFTRMEATVVVGDDGAQRARLRLDAAGVPADVAEFLLHRDTVAVHRILESLVPGGVGAVVEVDGARAELGFAASELARPLAGGGAEALAAAETACRDAVDGRRRRDGLARDVRVLIAQRLHTGAPMPEVAAMLAMSERTLRRRLAAEGVGYQELLDEVRQGFAAAWTHSHRTLPLADLAARLGYSSASAYLHARDRWTSLVIAKEEARDRPG